MRMRVPAGLAAAVVLGLGLTACGDDDDSGATATTEAPAAPSEETTAPPDDTDTTAGDAPAEGATVAVADSDLGPILVDGEERTLYLFTNDTSDVSTCSGGCADTWPALVADDPTGGDGVDPSLLGTSARDDGANQVTYNAHPLYHFASDAAPGDTNGQAVGGVWFVVDADGNAVEG